ncbi:MAG: hypothetical protein ACKVH8_13995 [Pirellulales bacterium]|jgi:hypothetical protein
MNNISAEANFLRCGYEMGFFEKEDIERWADSQILAVDVPSDTLIELALIREKLPADVIALLLKLGPEKPSKLIEMGFIGLLLQLNRIDGPNAISRLYSLADEQELGGDIVSEIYHLDDGYDLAVDSSIGTVEEILGELEEFIEPFAIDLRNQYPEFIDPLME